MNDSYLNQEKMKEVGCFYLGKKKSKEKWRWLEKKIPLHFFLLFLFCFLGILFLFFHQPDFLKNDKRVGLASVNFLSDLDDRQNLDLNGDFEPQFAKLPLSNNIFYGLPLSGEKEKPKEGQPKPKKVFTKKIASRTTSKLDKNNYLEIELNKEEYKNGKYIEVDISKQVMAVYGDGELKGLYKVSTGMPGMRTPTGNFKVLRKSANVWSNPCQCWMPYAMEFKSGLFIHELPLWPGGAREGENHLGIPVSHGCVRLGIGPAQEVYNFAEIGTPVIIHQ